MSRLTPSKLLLKDGSERATVHGLPSLLANMLMARTDFVLRCVVSLLYGVSSRIVLFMTQIIIK